MSSQGERKRILVVDDDRELRELLQSYLSQNGYQVATLADGSELQITLAERFAADLVVLDLMLPGEDGFSLCRRLRSTSELPVIMLTASAEDTERIIGLEIGADDFVAKPFNPRELLARIKAVLRRSQFNEQPGEASAKAPRFLLFAGWRLDTISRDLIDPQVGSTPNSRTLQKSPIMGKKECSYVEEKKVQRRVQARCC